ncbi:hypothetical protein [Geosporobacter ferrireducens]|uniref:DUF4468 domain-containing protein n=1 Tax=Geosporobacter ferrireducens TaxID=1424294 RepID=A0A1D8GJD2_9FIRM|nr:hypothetical protein [Geosporobacter ferrireducens]AOT70942.1 hypothetical protein Gferi_16050 [Geosporobacter ferrireducens]MTI53653.1 hypothetical protein [Geosporobacter ferrireducens]
MKKSFVISMLVVISLLFAGCDSDSIKADKENVNIQADSEVDKTNMDEVISDYIIRYVNVLHKPTEKQFEEHRIYGIEEKADRITVYLFSIFDGYSFSDGYFKNLAYSTRYVVIELEKKNGQFEVVNYKDSVVSEDVKKMFPTEYAEKALNEKPKDLHDAIKSKVELWLKSQGRMEKTEGS